MLHQCASYLYATVLADKNNEAKREQSPCNSGNYACGIHFEEEEEEEKVDVVMAMEERPTWDANFV